MELFSLDQVSPQLSNNTYLDVNFRFRAFPFATIWGVLPGGCVNSPCQWLKSKPLFSFGIVCQSPEVSGLWIHDVSPVLFTVHVFSHPGWFSYTLEPNTFLPRQSLWAAQKPKLMVILRNPGLLFIVSWTSSSGRVLRGGLIQTGYLAAEQNDTQRDEVIWRRF